MGQRLSKKSARVGGPAAAGKRSDKASALPGSISPNRGTSKRSDQRRRTGTAVARAITRAEALLPGRPADDGKRDRRWQAIIRVGEFINSEPEAVLEFVLRWGKHAQRDLQAAIATCLLEHLLGSHFHELFPRVREAALKSKNFASTFKMCSWDGEAKLPGNAAQLTRLNRHLQRIHRK